jgi:hypothetical protein
VYTAAAEASGSKATAVANNVVKCMLNTVDGCKVLVITSRSNSRLGALEEIYMRYQRQMNIHTVARSRPWNAMIAIASLMPDTADNIFFPNSGCERN